MGRSAQSPQRAQDPVMTTPTDATHRPSGHRGNPIELMFLGIGWLSIAATLVYVAVATPLVGRLLLSGRVSPSTGVVGLLELAMVGIVPLSLATAGVARLTAAFRAVSQSRPHFLSGLVHPQPLTLSLAGGLDLSGSQTAPGLSVGRFGVVVPSARDNSPVRHGSPWEMDVDGEWLRLNAPLRELNLRSGTHSAGSASGKGHFGVKVYTAVVTSSWEIEKGAGCAVLRPDEILPFLATGPAESPAQRSIAQGL
jgi:hypothetical protein